MSFLKFWEELEAMKPLDLSGLTAKIISIPTEKIVWAAADFDEYLDWLEEASGEQEVPEDF